MRHLKLLFVILFFSHNFIFAQDVDSTISKGSYGAMDVKYVKVKKEGKDPYFSACIFFYNAEYKILTDVGLIYFTKENFTDFVTDLEKSIAIMDKKNGEDISFNRKTYTLTIYGNKPGLYIYDEKGKYNAIWQRQAYKLLNWLKTIDANTLINN